VPSFGAGSAAGFGAGVAQPRPVVESFGPETEVQKIVQTWHADLQTQAQVYYSQVGLSYVFLFCVYVRVYAYMYMYIYMRYNIDVCVCVLSRGIRMHTKVGRCIKRDGFNYCMHVCMYVF
jgi:hypothetical protein